MAHAGRHASSEARFEAQVLMVMEQTLSLAKKRERKAVREKALEEATRRDEQAAPLINQWLARQADAMAKARRVEYALSSHIAAYKDSKEKDKQKVAMGARPPHYEQLRRNRYDGDITRPAAPGEDDAFVCASKPESRAEGDAVCQQNVAMRTECTPGRCPLGDGKCCNQRLQRRQYAPGLRLKDTGLPDKGWGVYASQGVKQGALVAEYIGEVVSEALALERLEGEYSNESHHYVMMLGAGCVVDATRAGCVARFINHSCAPNCVAQKWTVGGETRVGIFATRDIGRNEEVTYDYRMESFGGWRQACRCGAPNCRGWLAANASDGAGPSTPIPLPSQRLPDSQMPQRNALKTAPTLGKLPTTPRIVPKKLAPNSPRVVASNAKKAKLACAANAGAATERLPAKPKVPREAERSPTDDDAAMAAALFRSMNGLRAR